MSDMFAIRESAKRCWKNGGKSTDNPWQMYEARWCVWSEQWGKCSDDYMDSPNRALDALEAAGDSENE